LAEQGVKMARFIDGSSLEIPAPYPIQLAQQALSNGQTAIPPSSKNFVYQAGFGHHFSPRYLLSFLAFWLVLLSHTHTHFSLHVIL
jgi:hypothetical protein